jgi:two-component system, sensor histidine kinase and response regulator
MIDPLTENKKDKILIVDDEESLRLLLTSYLEDSGYEAVGVENGIECLQMVQSYLPDLIILDVHMPIMNGFQTAVELRKIKALERIPIIFLTGASTPTALKEGFEAGGDEYLYKPINTEELLIRIKALLRMHHAEDEATKIRQHFEYLLIQDFLNYSTAVKVPLSLLADEYIGTLNEQQKEIIEVATKALDEHIRILQDYAIVVKFNPKNILLTKSKFDIAELVEQVLSNLDAFIEERNLNIHKNFPSGDKQVDLDRNHLSQAFQLLISQAISQTPKDGNINITVEFAVENSQKVMRFYVHDGGPPLDKEELDLMIDRFEQARMDKVSLDKNISLTLCKMIVEAHSGKFWAESSPPIGNYYKGSIPIV